MQMLAVLILGTHMIKATAQQIYTNGKNGTDNSTLYECRSKWQKFGQILVNFIQQAEDLLTKLNGI